MIYEFAWKDDIEEIRKFRLSLGEYRIASDEEKKGVYLFSRYEKNPLPGIDAKYISRYSKGGTLVIECTPTGIEVAVGRNSVNDVRAGEYFLPLISSNSLKDVETLINPVTKDRIILPIKDEFIIPRENVGRYKLKPNRALRLKLELQDPFKPEKLIGILFCIEEQLP